ncbi:MAG: hypothetical protein ACQEQC_06480 [Elusimicrobiota bacterium]
MKKLNKFKILIFIGTGIMLSVITGSGCTDDKYTDFISGLPTPAEYNLFANGGWSGNWYVGYGHGWINKVPRAKTKEYDRFFIGAKLGRAKTEKQIEKILGEQESDIEPSDGPYRIHIGLSGSVEQRPQAKLLTTTDKIPREGSPTRADEYVRESKWFWVEVSEEEINKQDFNYIHLWSPDKELNSVKTAPVLAGGIGEEKGENSFLVKEGGETTGINFFQPGLAIKMVKKGSPESSVEITDLRQHPVVDTRMVVNTKVTGNYITEVTLEINNGNGWKDIGYPVDSAPYDLVFDYKGLPSGDYKVRCCIKDWFENLNFSKEKKFTVPK